CPPGCHVYRRGAESKPARRRLQSGSPRSSRETPAMLPAAARRTARDGSARERDSERADVAFHRVDIGRPAPSEVRRETAAVARSRPEGSTEAAGEAEGTPRPERWSSRATTRGHSFVSAPGDREGRRGRSPDRRGGTPRAERGRPVR